MDGSRSWLDRLLAATNDHDLDELVSCFADGYRNESPAHPARGFTGAEQVRRNWEQIFAFVPDVRAEVTAIAMSGTSVWTEWDMRGTRRDGTSHRMAGVVIFEVVDDLATSARFYLEPVDDAAATVDDAVRQQVVR